jgi:hypothetical protein
MQQLHKHAINLDASTNKGVIGPNMQPSLQLGNPARTGPPPKWGLQTKLGALETYSFIKMSPCSGAMIYMNG